MLDPLWSTEQTAIEHSGCEATRVEKEGYISTYPVAMRNLRVCTQQLTDYNCGQCEKCLRTMINLRAAGASNRCETLPEVPGPETIAGFVLDGDHARALALDNLRALERLGNEPELARALDTALKNTFGAEYARSQLAAKKGITKHRQRAERFKSRAEEPETSNERLKERTTKLKMSNAHLKGHYSSRRYRLADLLANGALKMPGIMCLLRKAAEQTDPSR